MAAGLEAVLTRHGIDIERGFGGRSAFICQGHPNLINIWVKFFSGS